MGTQSTPNDHWTWPMKKYKREDLRAIVEEHKAQIAHVSSDQLERRVNIFVILPDDVKVWGNYRQRIAAATASKVYSCDFKYPDSPRAYAKVKLRLSEEACKIVSAHIQSVHRTAQLSMLTLGVDYETTELVMVDRCSRLFFTEMSNDGVLIGTMNIVPMTEHWEQLARQVFDSILFRYTNSHDPTTRRQWIVDNHDQLSGLMLFSGGSDV